MMHLFMGNSLLLFCLAWHLCNNKCLEDNERAMVSDHRTPAGSATVSAKETLGRRCWSSRDRVLVRTQSEIPLQFYSKVASRKHLLESAAEQTACHLKQGDFLLARILSHLSSEKQSAGASHTNAFVTSDNDDVHFDPSSQVFEKNEGDKLKSVSMRWDGMKGDCHWSMEFDG